MFHFTQSTIRLLFKQQTVSSLVRSILYCYTFQYKVHILITLMESNMPKMAVMTLKHITSALQISIRDNSQLMQERLYSE